MEEIEKHLPAKDKRYIAEHNIKFYTIDGINIGREIGLGGRINTVLQSAFFKLANIIPADDAVKLHERRGNRLLRQEGRQGRCI